MKGINLQIHFFFHFSFQNFALRVGYSHTSVEESSTIDGWNTNACSIFLDHTHTSYIWISKRGPWCQERKKKMRWKRQKASSHQHLTVIPLWELGSEGLWAAPWEYFLSWASEHLQAANCQFGKVWKVLCKVKKTVSDKLKTWQSFLAFRLLGPKMQNCVLTTY